MTSIYRTEMYKPQVGQNTTNFDDILFYVDYSKCRWVERRNTKLRGNRQPTSPLLVANLDMDADEREQVSQQLPSRMGNCVFQTDKRI